MTTTCHHHLKIWVRKLTQQSRRERRLVGLHTSRRRSRWKRWDWAVVNRRVLFPCLHLNLNKFKKFKKYNQNRLPQFPRRKTRALAACKQGSSAARPKRSQLQWCRNQSLLSLKLLTSPMWRHKVRTIRWRLTKSRRTWARIWLRTKTSGWMRTSCRSCKKVPSYLRHCRTPRPIRFSRKWERILVRLCRSTVTIRISERWCRNMPSLCRAISKILGRRR